MANQNAAPHNDVYAWERCSDDGPFDQFAFSANGHHERSLGVLLALARAVAYDGGYDPAETVGYVASAKFHQGYMGEHPTKYDYVPCDEGGICLEDYDDDGNEIVLTDFWPATWAIMKCDPPLRKRS